MGVCVCVWWVGTWLVGWAIVGADPQKRRESPDHAFPHPCARVHLHRHPNHRVLKVEIDRNGGTVEEEVGGLLRLGIARAREGNLLAAPSLRIHGAV